MKLNQKTILITGGTSGICLELATQLLQRDNTVIGTGRDQEKLDDAKRALPGVHTFQSDVSDPWAIAVLHASLLAQGMTKQAVAGIEAGKLEIRPGLSNVLKAMSRIAPQFMFQQMVKMAKPKN